jgi:hypothetical protein
MNKKLIVLAVASALGVTSVLADNNDSKTLTVGGTIVESLALGAADNIAMPDVTFPDAGEDTFVTLACDDAGDETVTYDAVGGNPFADGTAAATAVGAGSANTAVGNETGGCGGFPVTGQGDFFYTLATTLTTANIETGVDISAPSCRSASADSTTTGTLTAGGTDTIWCGATVTVGETASTGTYSGGSITVAVVYD